MNDGQQPKTNVYTQRRERLQVEQVKEEIEDLKRGLAEMHKTRPELFLVDQLTTQLLKWNVARMVDVQAHLDKLHEHLGTYVEKRTLTSSSVFDELMIERDGVFRKKNRC